MDAATFSAVASIASALAVCGGFFWTIYRARTTQSRRANHDLFSEWERKQELARKDEELAYLRRQNDWLSRRNQKLTQAVAKAYNLTESEIDLRLNGGPPPQKTLR